MLAKKGLNPRVKLPALLLCALSLAAGDAQAAPQPAAEIEAEIRRELSSLRARLLNLEAKLKAFDERGGLSAKEDSAAAVPPPKAVADAEPAGGIPLGVVSSGGQAIAFTGLIDAYYTHNANGPPDGRNALYFTNPNARGFGLNQAKLEVETSGGGPVGFRSDIWFGSAGRIYWSGLTGPGPLEDVVYLQQAYGYYRFAGGAQFDAGLFQTPVGIEVMEPHRNWNYSVGLLSGWNEAGSHLGARLSAPLSDTLNAAFLLINGYLDSEDRNAGKLYGLQGSFEPNDRFNTTLTWINGPESDGIWFKNLSWNAYAGLHERFEVKVNLDWIEADAAGVRAVSWGMAGYARLHLSERVRLACRFEFLDDAEAWSTGVKQFLSGNTFTFEVQPVRGDPRFLTRFEYRRDRSNAAFFGCSSCGDSGLAAAQSTFTAAMMWVLGPRQ